MKKLLLLIVSFFLFAYHSAAQYTIAEDNAGNYSSWANGDNNGFGFGGWNLYSTGGSAGSFLGASHANLINTGGKAFGMWGNPGYFNAHRFFSIPLNINQIFTIELSVHWRDGNRGIDLISSADEPLFNFNISNTGYGNTGWGWQDNSAIRLTQLIQ